MFQEISEGEQLAPKLVQNGRYLLHQMSYPGGIELKGVHVPDDVTKSAVLL